MSENLKNEIDKFARSKKGNVRSFEKALEEQLQQIAKGVIKNEGKSDD